MFVEIKRLFEYFKTDKKGMILRNRAVLVILIFAFLLIINRFLFINFSDRAEFYIAITRAKSAITGNQNIYSSEIIISSQQAADLGFKAGNIAEKFSLPLYALIFYVPFTIIPDFNWSMSLWMTLNQILCFFSVYMLLEILNWKLPDKFKYALILFSIFFYFAFINIIGANTSIIQVSLFVFAITKLKKNEFIFSGILLGLAAFNPYQFLVPIVMIIALNIYRKRTLLNTWMVISIILFSLLFIIFDMKWPLSMLKNLLVQPAVYPFMSFRNYINEIFPKIDSSVIEAIPVILFIWILIEWLRTPKESFLQELWLICLSFTINPLLTMWKSPYPMFAYIVVFVYTLSLWYDRSSNKFKIFAAVIFGVTLIAAPLIQMLVNKTVLSVENTYAYNIAIMFLLLINLYWVRLWVVNPYYLVNQLDED